MVCNFVEIGLKGVGRTGVVNGASTINTALWGRAANGAWASVSPDNSVKIPLCRMGAILLHRLDGYLNLFWVMMNPPKNKMEKAAFVLDRAMHNPKTLTYREFYRKKHCSGE
jgi:hypothetical protein